MLITDQSGRGRSVILCSNDQNGLNVITDRLLYLTRLCRLFNLDTSVSRRLVLVYARPVIIYHPLPVPIPNPRWPRLHSLPAFTVPGHLHSFLLYLPSIPPQIRRSERVWRRGWHHATQGHKSAIDVLHYHASPPHLHALHGRPCSVTSSLATCGLYPLRQLHSALRSHAASPAHVCGAVNPRCAS